jgi:hypothetical protein
VTINTAGTNNDQRKPPPDGAAVLRSILSALMRSDVSFIGGSYQI